MLPHFIFVNQSILSILYASLFLVCIPTFRRIWQTSGWFTKIVLYLVAYLLILLLIFSQGRAGWIGLAAGSYVLSIKRFRFPTLSSKKGGLTWLFFLVLVSVFFWIKKDSSEGRLLIYKISANIFTNHWLWGIGLGKYKATYNVYQADYFSKHSIDSNEALLADNSFYAFNDLWQFLIEIGMLRFICLSFFVIILLQYLKKYVISPKKKYVFCSSLSALVCILVASLFSYPFHVFVIQFFALIYLSAMLNCLEPRKEVVQPAKWLLPFFKFFVKAAIVFLTGHALFKLYLIQKAKEASDLSLAGFKKQSLDRFAFLSNCVKDGPISFALAKHLYRTNELKKARVVLEEMKKYYIDNEVCKLSAVIAQELGDMKVAEREYMTAIYMVPNRMISRYELYLFHLANGDTLKALSWAESILHMPVKVPSAETQNIKNFIGRQQYILQTRIK